MTCAHPHLLRRVFTELQSSSIHDFRKTPKDNHSSHIRLAMSGTESFPRGTCRKTETGRERCIEIAIVANSREFRVSPPSLCSDFRLPTAERTCHRRGNAVRRVKSLTRAVFLATRVTNARTNRNNIL